LAFRALALTLSWCTGYDQGVFSGVIVAPWFLEKFNHPDAELMGTVNALFDVGGAIGAIMVFLMGGYLGRKRSILVSLCGLLA